MLFSFFAVTPAAAADFSCRQSQSRGCKIAFMDDAVNHSQLSILWVTVPLPTVILVVN